MVLATLSTRSTEHPVLLTFSAALAYAPPCPVNKMIPLCVTDKTEKNTSIDIIWEGGGRDSVMLCGEAITSETEMENGREKVRGENARDHGKDHCTTGTQTTTTMNQRIESVQTV